MRAMLDFGWTVRSLARLRQRGLCACCGEDLDDVEEHPHCVLPDPGGAGAPANGWLSSADNCVILCPACDARVQRGESLCSDSLDTLPGDFVHSHGSDRRRHNAWAVQLVQRARLLWQ